MTTEKDQHPCDIESPLFVDHLAHLIVELGEEPDKNNTAPNLITRDLFLKWLPRMSRRKTPVQHIKGLGLRLWYLIIREWDNSSNQHLFSDGFQIVVNLSKRKLTPAEIFLLSKGLSFRPTPRDIDIFALRKDMSDYVRRLRLKEYFFEQRLPRWWFFEFSDH